MLSVLGSNRLPKQLHLWDNLWHCDEYLLLCATGWEVDDEEEEEWELVPTTHSSLQHDVPEQHSAPQQHRVEQHSDPEPAGMTAVMLRVPRAERDLSDIPCSMRWLPRRRAAKFGLRRMSRAEDETLVEQLWQREYRVGAPRHWKLHDLPEEPEMEAAELEEHARETEHAAREAQETARVLREEAERQAFIESVPQGLTLEGLGVLRWECYSRQHSQVHQMLSKLVSLPPVSSCNSNVKRCVAIPHFLLMYARISWIRKTGRQKLTSSLLVPFACFYLFILHLWHSCLCEDPPDALALKSTSGRLQMTQEDLRSCECCQTQANFLYLKDVVGIIEDLTISGNVVRSTDPPLILQSS